MVAGGAIGGKGVMVGGEGGEIVADGEGAVTGEVVVAFVGDGAMEDGVGAFATGDLFGDAVGDDVGDCANAVTTNADNAMAKNTQFEKAILDVRIRHYQK